MADFFDREAEVSEGSDDEEQALGNRDKKKKKVNKFKANVDSSEEDEEDDEETLRNEMKDLINDEEEEEEEESDEEVTGRKRGREDDELEEDLEDEDYDLIEENLGVRVQRKKKFRRIRRLEDDDEEDENQNREPADEREAIANELFDDDEDLPTQQPQKRMDRGDREAIDDRFAALSGSDRSDEESEDNFIVDDDDRPIPRGHKKKKSQRYTDEALQQAQDIFGVDFDFDDVEGYEEGDYEDEGEEDEDYEGDQDMNETQRSRVSRKGRRRRTTRKSIFEIYEPSELERSHLTQLDNEIRNSDVPERFQLRSVPVNPLYEPRDETEVEEPEVDLETEWIYNACYKENTISIQNESDNSRRPIGGAKEKTTVEYKIRNALKFMRNELFEVPFIAYYRKEYIQPELNIDDLWLIYKYDEKWCQLKQRRENMLKLFENMRNYQNEKMNSEEYLLQADEHKMKLIEDSDIDRIRNINSFEDLHDSWLQFQLHHSADLTDMKKKMLEKERRRRIQEAPEEERERIMQDVDEELQSKMTSLKLAQRKDVYTICKEAGLMPVTELFGLTPLQFGENLRDNYQRHDIQQHYVHPLEVAKQYICNRFPTPEAVLDAVGFMVAKQISCEPTVRRVIRNVYFERAKIHVKATKKGVKEIDENHPCFTYKYLINKPVTDLYGEQFLNLVIAQKEGLVEIEFTIDKKPLGNEPVENAYMDEINTLYHKDEFRDIVNEWNQERLKVMKLALNKFLFTSFEKELRAKLLAEATNMAIKKCSIKLRNWLRIAPYQVDPAVEEEEDFDTREGVRVMGFAFMPSNEEATFAAMIDGDGEVSDFIKLESFMIKPKPQEYQTEQERNYREKDLAKLRRFILNKKPHAIAVGADSIVTRNVVEDLRAIVTDLVESEQFPNIPVEILDNDVAAVYSGSKKANADFHAYPVLLRQAISLARRLQDPLTEYSQLCTADEEILCLKYHPLQEHFPRDDFLNALYLEFVNVVNDVGVDVNRCIVHPYSAQLLQFVCGLGPRKASYILRSLKKQQTPLLENRTQLVTNLNIGAKVFINCAGFIKIDTMQLQDTGTETYIEVLDSTRVHPEGYEWARKMAVDALEYDEDNEVNPAEALNEILENPDKLKDLDLDAFAEELERQGLGIKSITLYDIRHELTYRYKDNREPYHRPEAEILFQLYTKETTDTFYLGKLVMGQVIQIARRKPAQDLKDGATPLRDDETGLWKCPFCYKDDFPELSEVWSHFDADDCPGAAIGVKVRLDNGVSGLIPTNRISDKEVVDPSERVKPGMTVHCRITKLNVERFFVELTCRTSDLSDTKNEYLPPKDIHYGYEFEDKDRKVESESKKKQHRQAYVKRIIVHPSFHNIDFKQAEKMLAAMDQGEAIIRPSSKFNDHLTLTWKVFESINQHVDIREENKDNAFSLGHQLFIGNESYEDLDEIIARYVQPMASYARDLINFKYFRPIEGKRDVVEKVVREEKQKTPTKIPYCVTASKDFPGKFLLSYLPNMKIIHEFITITPDGLKYRNITHRSVSHLFKWFKVHFNDKSTFPRTPISTPALRTPIGHSSFIGSQATPNIDVIQRAAANLPNHVYNTLSQVANATPSFGGAQAAYGSSSMPPPGYSVSGGYYPPHATPAPPTPGMTPNVAMTPRSNYPTSTPGSMPPPSGRAGPSNRPTSRSGADWSNMATGWNVKKEHKPRTPAHLTPGASSQMSISPTQTNNTPRGGGDQTPLYDEGPPAW